MSAYSYQNRLVVAAPGPKTHSPGEANVRYGKEFRQPNE
jgi:hypothetical protein